MESTKKMPEESADFGSSFVHILDMVFNECPDGIVYKDNTLCYRMANSAFCKYFGIKNKENFINKKNAVFLSPENQKLIFDINCAILEEKAPLSYIMSLNNNPNIILSITSSPIYLKNEFLGIISIIKDITQEETLKENFVNKHYEYIDSEKKISVAYRILGG